MENITITKEFAQRCAEALLKVHNSIPKDERHRSVMIISFRSLYEDLRKLDMAFLIACAQRPEGIINPLKITLKAE